MITGNLQGLMRGLADAVLANGHNLVITTREAAQHGELAERYGNQKGYRGSFGSGLNRAHGWRHLLAAGFEPKAGR